MKQITYILILLFSLLSVVHGELHINHESPILDTKVNLKATRRATTCFALDVYSKAKKGNDNFFFSPLSINMALSLVYGGSSNNTEKQIAKALQTNLSQERYHESLKELQAMINTSLKKSKIKLHIANLLACQKNYPFHKAYIAFARDKYSAEIVSKDFINNARIARTELNKWVEKKTEGKLKDFLPKGTPSSYTRLMILNAIYFHGQWEHEFYEHLTKDKPFWIDANKSVDVPMMHIGEELAYGETRSAQVLSLSYRRGLADMIIVLPKNRDGLAKLEKGLDEKNFYTWISSLKKPGVFLVTASIPKFSITKETELTSILSDMGIKDLFSPEKSDLTNISHERPLYVSSALHKTGIIVDEKGTEAWAATEMDIDISIDEYVELPRRIFNANHPFLFFIREKSSGVILFMGRVMNPAKVAGS